MQKAKTYTKFFLSFLCLLVLTGCESRREIVHGIDEKEANEILVYLDSKGITAAKVKAADSGGGGGQKIQLYNITVSEEEHIYATSLLNQVGLPRRTGQSLLGIFKESGLVPSELQEKVRYQAGLAEQISTIIRKIDGILDAEVQISFPEEDPLNPGQKKGDITASIYVKHSGVLDDPNTHLDTKIRRLVTSSITGLEYDNVTIIPDRARFTEYTFEQIKDPDKKLISVWSVILAKQSENRFRLIFLTFVGLIFILLLALVWIIFKVYPLLQSQGGVKALFRLQQIENDLPAEKPEKEEETEEESEENKEGEEKEQEGEEEKEEENMDVT